MEPEGLLPCVQEPAACPDPEPYEPSPNHATPFYTVPLRSILIVSSHLRLGLTAGFFLQDFPIWTLYKFVFSLYLSHNSLLDFCIVCQYTNGKHSELWRVNFTVHVYTEPVYKPRVTLQWWFPVLWNHHRYNHCHYHHNHHNINQCHQYYWHWKFIIMGHFILV
jgi:hypothetical protein